MPKLFGTDGVRGVANSVLTPDLALALGRAAGHELAGGGGTFVVGRDTRLSGPMLAGALSAGLCSAGASVLDAGVIPTAAVAFLTLDEKAAAGAVISASHNPVADNGIKFFSAAGTKTSSVTEQSIENRMLEDPPNLPTGADVGVITQVLHGEDRYVAHLLSSISEPLKGLRVVLDCAFGAAWSVGPRTFREAGADVVAIHAEPDGSRINVDCGSTSLDKLSRRVTAEGADLGLAFDGDADRVLAVDENGAAVDGDRLLGLLALHLMEEGRLIHKLLVSTVMANLGFKRAMEERGVEVVCAPVGDKFVAEAMTETGAVIGGEQSGHVIFAQHSTTGDGVLTGLQLAQVLRRSDSTLSALAHFFEPFPQILLNVTVGNRDGLEGCEAVWAEVRKLEDELGAGGRVVLRASGTEPLVRVMVEAEDRPTAERAAKRLAQLVEAELGA